MQPVTEKNLDGYGTPAIDWNRVSDRLASHIPQGPDSEGAGRHTTWLATTNPDGSPHVMPLGALWVDDAFYFTSGPGTRKSKNIAKHPESAITLSTHDLDLVFEGEPKRVTDNDELERVAQVFGGGDWQPHVEDGAFVAEFSAPSAGPPPWYLYRLRPKRIYALGTAEPYGATRFDF
ncbi:MAG: pyridoxamine 5'-phosphate oxidase family protein [Acidimicrobiia bacterium]